MLKKKNNANRLKSLALFLVLAATNRAWSQDAATPNPAPAYTPPYTKLAPVDQYLMLEQGAEIALARTAAPEAIARDAEILVLGRQGFETAAKGKNGFVCIVGRSWTSTVDAEFWNPKVRVPMCVNAAAARTYLLRITRITGMALAGRTLAQVNAAMAAAVAAKELPPMDPGAMCYMMGKQGYGGDSVPHWPSHLMFFYSRTDAASWGANLPGSPVVAVEDPDEQLTQFVVPVQRWSDGTEVLPESSTHVHR